MIFILLRSMQVTNEPMEKYMIIRKGWVCSNLFIKKLCSQSAVLNLEVICENLREIVVLLMAGVHCSDQPCSISCQLAWCGQTNHFVRQHVLLAQKKVETDFFVLLTKLKIRIYKKVNTSVSILSHLNFQLQHHM